MPPYILKLYRILSRYYTLIQIKKLAFKIKSFQAIIRLENRFKQMD